MPRSLAWQGSRWGRGLSHSLLWYSPVSGKARSLRSETWVNNPLLCLQPGGTLSLHHVSHVGPGRGQGSAGHASMRACPPGPPRGRRKRMKGFSPATVEGEAEGKERRD